MKVPCQTVAVLPEGALSAVATARYWGRDRAGLAECRRRHAALVKSIDAVEEQAK